MLKSFGALFKVPARWWLRLYRYLTDHNKKAVDEWGASLQYKRRYTNPDDAKRNRRAP